MTDDERKEAERLAEHPAAPALAQAIALRYARPLVIARAAMQEFVDKVDRGEARSRRSYGSFKAALAEIDRAFPPTPEVTYPAAPGELLEFSSMHVGDDRFVVETKRRSRYGNPETWRGEMNAEQVRELQRESGLDV